MEGQQANIIQMLQNIARDYDISNVQHGIDARLSAPTVSTTTPTDDVALKVLQMCQQAEGERDLIDHLNIPLYEETANVVAQETSRCLPHIRCQVDGCEIDLMHLKDYHQRYRICSEHLKCDFIIRDGQKMRFCQQCGKFQELESFDLDKRSCRERLRRHNERRRKRSTPFGQMMTHGADGERAVNANDGVASFDQDLGTIADLLSYMGACRDMDEAHVAAIMEGKNPSSLRTDQDALSSAKVISMILNKNVDSISPRPLVPNASTMRFLLQQFARLFHYQITDMQMVPCADAMRHYEGYIDIHRTFGSSVAKKLKTPDLHQEIGGKPLQKSNSTNPN